LQLSHAHCG